MRHTTYRRPEVWEKRRGGCWNATAHGGVTHRWDSKPTPSSYPIPAPCATGNGPTAPSGQVAQRIAAHMTGHLGQREADWEQPHPPASASQQQGGSGDSARPTTGSSPTAGG